MISSDAGSQALESYENVHSLTLLAESSKWNVIANVNDDMWSSSNTMMNLETKNETDFYQQMTYNDDNENKWCTLQQSN